MVYVISYNLKVIKLVGTYMKRKLTSSYRGYNEGCEAFLGMAMAIESGIRRKMGGCCGTSAGIRRHAIVNVCKEIR